MLFLEIKILDTIINLSLNEAFKIIIIITGLVFNYPVWLVTGPPGLPPSSAPRGQGCTAEGCWSTCHWAGPDTAETKVNFQRERERERERESWWMNTNMPSLLSPTENRNSSLWQQRRGPTKQRRSCRMQKIRWPSWRPNYRDWWRVPRAGSRLVPRVPEQQSNKNPTDQKAENGYNNNNYYDVHHYYYL